MTKKIADCLGMGFREILQHMQARFWEAVQPESETWTLKWWLVSIWITFSNRAANATSINELELNFSNKIRVKIPMNSVFWSAIFENYKYKNEIHRQFNSHLTKFETWKKHAKQNITQNKTSEFPMNALKTYKTLFNE